MWYAGWDGGGTKTEVCILDGEGKLLAKRVFGPLNPNGTDPERVRETVREAVEFMRSQPGGEAACGGTVIGAAGMSNLETRRLLKEALEEAGWHREIRLEGDQTIALAGAVDGPGAILIAGTGAICCGRDPEGNPFRVGGYGYLIDDGGSGYAIGRDILTAAVRAFDGRGRPTLLSRLAAERLGIDPSEIQRMITWLYAPDTGKKEIASLAPLLTEALGQGDETARKIARKAAADLAELVITGWRKSRMDSGELAVTGSILTRIPEVREETERLIHAAFPRIRILPPRRTPAEGAARMALETEHGT